MTNPTSNFGWQMPEPTDLVTNLPADFEVFGQAVDTDFVDLLGGTTGQVLSKTSATDLDFTWVAQSAGMTNPMTTTGDSIYSSSGSTPARLGIGSAGQVLTVASGLPSWATPAAGGGMTLLSTTTLSTTTTTIGISASTYKNLYFLINGINLSGSDYVYFETNGTANKFDYIKSSGYNIGGVSTDMNVAADYNLNYTIQNGGNADNSFIINIYDNASTTRFKTFNGTGGFFDNSSRRNAYIAGGIIRDNAAITTCRFFTGGATMNAGTVYIYGVN